VTVRGAILTKVPTSILVVCGLLAASTPPAAAAAPSAATAQPPAAAPSPQPGPSGSDAQAKARAQGLLSEGTAAYGRGDYAAALDKFTAAYKIFPSPKLWFNIGQANRDLGRPVEAVAAFDRFLREAGDAPPETLSEARRSAAELKTKLGQIKITCALDGADVTVDGKPVGSTPLGEMVWTTPGRHQIAVQHAGYSPAIEDASVAAGKTAAVTFDLRPIDLRAPGSTGSAALIGSGSTPTAPPTSNRKPIYKRTWFWIAAGVVVAAGAGTAVVLASRGSSSGGGGGGGLVTTLGTQKVFQ